jgi:ABC-type iron transport system FetAB ATPase subunit
VSWFVNLIFHSNAAEALSRGMKMKAALVSSLAYRPKLLVLDEPFSGLDPMVREDFAEGLVDSAGETSIGVVTSGRYRKFRQPHGYIEMGSCRFPKRCLLSPPVFANRSVVETRQRF